MLVDFIKGHKRTLVLGTNLDIGVGMACSYRLLLCFYQIALWHDVCLEVFSQVMPNIGVLMAAYFDQITHILLLRDFVGCIIKHSTFEIVQVPNRFQTKAIIRESQR